MNHYEVLHDAPGALAEVAMFDDNGGLVEVVRSGLSPDIAETIAANLNAKQEHNQDAI